jgi:Dolichyl-phosphate-mannose-protein mannosyltransferase
VSDPTPDTPAAGWKWVLAATLALGLAIRIWGTWYGLPFSYWVDEYHEVMRALELGSGEFNLNRTTKGGIYFLLFVEYGIYFVLLKIGGIVTTPEEFAEHFVRDPGMFYLLGRLTAAVFGGLAIYAVFRLARRAYSTTAGLLAAIFLAVNVLHTDLSRMVGVDVPMALFAIVALYFAQSVASTANSRAYLWAALFAALAATTKLPGILVLPSLLIAHAYGVASNGGGLKDGLLSRPFWLAVLLFGAVLLLTNPGIVGTTGYLSHFADSPVDSSDGWEAEQDLLASGGDKPNLFAYYAGAVAASMGWPLFAVGLASMAHAAWRRTPADSMLLAYIVLNYLVIASTTSHLYYPRYALPIVLAMAVLSGRAVADFWRFCVKRNGTQLAVAVAALVAWPIWNSAGTARELTMTDTRTLAKGWIEANIPTGSHVFIEGLKIGPIKGTVQLRETPEAIRRRVDYWRSREPKQARFLKLQLAALEPGGYRLRFARVSSVDTLAAYLAEGVEYFVVRPDYFQAARRADPSSARLLEQLRSDDRIELMKRFEGGTQTPIGPTLEIYRFDGRPDPAADQ